MNNDFERQNEHVALNAKRKMTNGSERQTKNAMTLDVKNEKVALNTKPTLNAKRKTTLDIELKTNNGSECQTEDTTRNAKMTMWL